MGAGTEHLTISQERIARDIERARERVKIRKQLETYDEERERGLLHDRSYSIKMEQYRLSLGR